MFISAYSPAQHAPLIRLMRHVALYYYYYFFFLKFFNALGSIDPEG